MYDRAITERFNEVYIEGNFIDIPNNKPNIELWEDLGGTKLGIFLGVSHHTGSLNSYWVLPASGITLSRTNIQQVTHLEAQTEQCKKRFEVYDIAIVERFNEVYIEGNFIDIPNNKPNIELWEDLAGDDETFHEEFSRVIKNEDIPEADDIFDPEEFDNYVNIELALDRYDDGPEFARVNKRLKEKDGRAIGIAADNPILYTRVY